MKTTPGMMIIFGIVAMFSCTSPDEEITLGKYRITYKAQLESGLWYGNYTDADGNEICVCDEPYQPDDWLHSFTTNEIPDNLTFEVISEFFEDSLVVDKPDVTASIFVNGELLKSLTNSQGDGKTKVLVVDGVADPTAVM
jgi:hypothetical protein